MSARACVSRSFYPKVGVPVRAIFFCSFAHHVPPAVRCAGMDLKKMTMQQMIDKYGMDKDTAEFVG